LAARELTLRVASAVVLLPAVIALVLWHERLAFGAVAILAGAIALDEYARIALKGRPARERVVVVLAGTALAVLLYLRPNLGHAGMIGVVVLVGTALLFGADDIPHAAGRFGAAVAGPFYIGGLVVALPLLQRDVVDGPLWVLVAMGLTFADDTGAYFVGRAFGKHKLAPAISPGKTVEGLAGGFVAAVAFVAIARATFFPGLTLVDCLGVGAIGGLLGPAGDLVKSLLKRSAGVKDSGRLIPGHGGMLDRIDALLFVGAFVLLWVRFVH
jgi:phosphatidate cytidylyltransferase